MPINHTYAEFSPLWLTREGIWLERDRLQGTCCRSPPTDKTAAVATSRCRWRSSIVQRLWDGVLLDTSPCWLRARRPGR